MSEFEIANDDGQRNNFPTKFMNKNRFNGEKRDTKSRKTNNNNKQTKPNTNILSDLAIIFPFLCARNTFFERF